MCHFTVSDRYGSADAMHEAVFSCLVATGKAAYSAYLSYRAASEAPLARLIFDELNHRSHTHKKYSPETLMQHD